MLALWEMSRLYVLLLLLLLLIYLAFRLECSKESFVTSFFRATHQREKLNKLKTCSLPQASFTLSFGSVHFSITLLMAHLVKLELMITVTTSNKGLFCEGFIAVASG